MILRPIELDKTFDMVHLRSYKLLYNRKNIDNFKKASPAHLRHLFASFKAPLSLNVECLTSSKFFSKSTELQVFNLLKKLESLEDFNCYQKINQPCIRSLNFSSNIFDFFWSQTLVQSRHIS